MKRWIAMLAAIVLCASGVMIASCEKTVSDEADSLSYEEIAVEDYVRLGDYTGLRVTREDGEDRGSAAWRTVMEQSEILGYPEEAVSYYIKQSEARCRYYAEENGVSYEDAMTSLGLSADSIRREAEEMVRADLLYHAVRRAAGIVLTEEEKEAHLDRYVDKFVDDWGYDRDYVIKNLSELVYDAMLYDKTTEYLIVNNEISD